VLIVAAGKAGLVSGDVGFVWLGRERVAEEDDPVARARGDLGTDLEVATQRSRLLPFDVEGGRLSEALAGRSGRHEVALAEEVLVFLYEIDEFGLLLVVGDEREAHTRAWVTA
jgi:hypothetical protein